MVKNLVNLNNLGTNKYFLGIIITGGIGVNYTAGKATVEIIDLWNDCRCQLEQIDVSRELYGAYTQVFPMNEK